MMTPYVPVAKPPQHCMSHGASMAHLMPRAREHSLMRCAGRTMARTGQMPRRKVMHARDMATERKKAKHKLAQKKRTTDNRADYKNSAEHRSNELPSDPWERIKHP